MLLPLQGHGLILRDFSMADVPAVFRIASTPGFSFYALAPATAPEEEREASAFQFVQNNIRLAQPDPATGVRENYKLALAFEERPDALVGYVAIDEWSAARGDPPDIGYLVDPAHQRKGYATIAGHLALQELFRLTGHDTVWATVHPANIPSERVLRRLGFVRTGVSTKVVRGVEEPRLRLDLYRKNFPDRLPLRGRETNSNLRRVPAAQAMYAPGESHV